jgi:hypothetical protein
MTGRESQGRTDIQSDIKRVKEEIRAISSLLNRLPKETLNERLDRCLMFLGHITIEHPELRETTDHLKEHVWSLLMKVSRRII